MSHCLLRNTNFVSRLSRTIKSQILDSSIQMRLKPPPISSVCGCRKFATTNESPAAFKLGDLNHVAIVVPDLEKATVLYRDVLGATVSDPEDLPAHGVTVVFINLGNTKLELLHPLGDKSPVAAFLDKNKAGELVPGMHHVCVEVDDIQEAMKELKAKKIRLLSEEPSIGAHGKPVIFLHPKDCNGVLTELEENKSDSSQNDNRFMEADCRD